MELVFLTIINMSITASYVLAAVLVLRLLLKRAPKWISCSLWLTVLFRLVCPVSFAASFSLLGRLLMPSTVAGNIEYIPADIGIMATPQVNLGISGLNEVLNNTLPQATPTASVNTLQLLISAGAWVWLAGFAAMLIYSIVSYIRLKRKVCTATLLYGNVYETDEIVSPFVCGFFKPGIYLPIGMNENEQACVLQHERTHLRRYDHLIKPFAFLVLAMHWFNPLIWLAFRLMSRDMEMSCDESVLRDLGHEEKAGYGEALVHLALKRPILSGSPLAFGESGTQGRVKHVLNYKKPVLWIAVAAIVIAVTVSASLLANPQNAGYSYVPTSAEALPQGIIVQPESPAYPAGTNEIRLIIQNQTSSTLQYGSRYAIEKYDAKSNAWYQVPFVKNAAFNGLLYVLKGQDSASFYIYLNMLQNIPGVGKYRVWFLDDRTTCEFTLTSESVATTNPADVVSGYLFVVDYLATEQDIRNLPLEYLAVDTTQLVGLSVEDKARFLKELEKYHLQILDKTIDELRVEGYIKTANGAFEKGAFIKIWNIKIKGSTITMDAFIYFAGTAGWGPVDFDITYDGSRWAITRTNITVQA
jgi:beta-lactamase regulating signal transducer with metallopeptidase domain